MKSAMEIIYEASKRIEKMAEAEGFEVGGFEQLRWLYPGVPEATILLKAACSEMGAMLAENRDGDLMTKEEVITLITEGIEAGFARISHDLQVSIELLNREIEKREGIQTEYEELPTRLYQLPDEEDEAGNMRMYASTAILLADGLELLGGEYDKIIMDIEESFLRGYLTGKTVKAPEPTGELPETLLNTPLTWEPYPEASA